MLTLREFFHRWFVPGGAALNPVEQDGFDACLNGNHQNPHQAGSIDHKAWERGQIEGYNEQARYY